MAYESSWAATIPLLLTIGGVVWFFNRKKTTGDSSISEHSNPSTTTVSGWFERFCWFVTLLAACFGFFTMVDASLTPSLSAPQFAAISAGACAKLLVPYVFTRSVQGWRRSLP